MPFHKLALAAACAAIALAPTMARAEDPGLGLDLSDEPKKDDKKDPGAPPPPSEARTPVTLEPSAKAGEGDLTEKDIASEDRVKSVQRKAFLRRRRFELSPMVFFTVNDAFFPKFGPGLRGSWFLHDNLGVGARFFQYNLIPNDNVRLAKRQLQSRLPFVLPKYSFNLDVMWSPIYGKVSVLNSIKAFDLYLVGGAGGVISQTSLLPADAGGGDGVHLSTHIGAGQRFALFDFLAIDVSAIETLYADRPNGGQKSVIQHVLSVNLGLSLYLPPSFEYRGP